tara:strand:+ start:1234 stop:2454 length:1221 start_codon:yes stop_codon:yes gene_type:complete
MATSLLPSAIKASKKTISADSITSLSKSSSTSDKLESIRKFLTLDFKRDRASFIMKRRQRQEEKKRLREENLEKKKESKFSLPSVNIPNPLQDIFSSIGNFFLFLGGGILFNKIYDAEKGLMGVAKVIEGIGKGIDFVASMVGSLTNFVDSTVKGYDNFMKKFKDITGVKQEDVDKFLEKFKMVINGTVIAALITLRSLPTLLRNRGRRGMGRDMGSGRSGFNKRQLVNTQGNDAIRRYIKRHGIDAARKRFGNQAVKNLGGKFARSAVTNTARKGIVALLGKTGTKSLLQFSKRFISPVLRNIPIIGAVADFLLNYFVFKEPLGHAAFKAIGAGLFGSLGAAIGGPFAIFTGIGGAILGDFLGGKLADAILGDGSVDTSGIDEYTEYTQNYEITNNIIQPEIIET